VCLQQESWPIRRARGARVCASTRWSTMPAPPAPALVSKTPPQTIQALNFTQGAREEAQCGSCRSWTPCAGAPFTKPLPPPRCTRTGEFIYICLMNWTGAHNWNVFQIWQNYLRRLVRPPKYTRRHQYKTHAWREHRTSTIL